MLKKLIMLLVSALSLNAMDDESHKRKRDEVSEPSRNVRARNDTQMEIDSEQVGVAAGAIVPMAIDNNEQATSKRNTSTVINMLIAAGSKTALERSLTPLMDAVHANDLEKIKEVLSSVVDVSAQDAQGRTALFIASQDGKADIARELLKCKNININLEDNDGMTPLQIAVTSRDTDTVSALLDARPTLEQRDKKLGFTPLARAARSGNTGIIKLLLSAGANPIAQVTLGDKVVPVIELVKADDKEATALIQDKLQEYKDRGLAVIKALENEKPEEARKFLAQGIEVNVKKDRDITLLHLAAMYGDKDIVKILIDSKAYINAKDNDDETPIYWALVEGHKDISKLLIGSKADINAKTSEYGTTPVHRATDNGYIEIVSLLIDSKADVNPKNNWDEIPLHIAVGKGHKDIAKLLIDSKADVNAKDIEGDTPLHWAATYGHKDIAQMLKDAGATL